MENNLQGAFVMEVSKRIKLKRIEKRLTLQELADKSGVSKGLISQIENGRSIPSLPVMFSIIQSLDTGLSDFFVGLELDEPTVIVERADDYISFEKENATGFYYKRMMTRTLGASTVDLVLLDLHPGSHREEVCTEAFEYKYILNGEVEYLINGETYTLKKGDSLFFDGRLSHVPKNNTKEICTMLIVYFFDQKI